MSSGTMAPEVQRELELDQAFEDGYRERYSKALEKLKHPLDKSKYSDDKIEEMVETVWSCGDDTLEITIDGQAIGRLIYYIKELRDGQKENTP